MPSSMEPGEGHVALVTGGTRGIGRAIAVGLLQLGLRVAVTGTDPVRVAAVATDVAAEAGVAAGDCIGLPLDLRTTDATGDCVAAVVHEFGRLDVLVNNAGIYLEAPHYEPRLPGSALEEPLEAIKRSFRVNTLGPLMLARAAVPEMRRAGGGRIVNVSSGSGQLHEMGGEDAGYRISKTALNAVTCILAAELSGSGILVNALCPGWVRTDLGSDAAPRSVEEGADTALWLATLPENGPTGGFFRDRTRIPW